MAESKTIAHSIPHISNGNIYLLLVLDDYVSVAIDGIEYRSFISVSNIHIYPYTETTNEHYELFKSLIANATIQKNKTIGNILVVDHIQYSMFLQLFTMEQIKSIIEQQVKPIIEQQVKSIIEQQDKK